MFKVQQLLDTNGIDLKVDTELSDIKTGGLVLYDKNGKAFYVFHGRNAGMTNKDFEQLLLKRAADQVTAGLYNHPEAMFPHDEARNVSITDDTSVRRAGLSHGWSRDTTPELYPGLGDQADAVIAKYGKTNVHGVWYSNGGVKGHWLAKNKGIGGRMLCRHDRSSSCSSVPESTLVVSSARATFPTECVPANRSSNLILYVTRKKK